MPRRRTLSLILFLGMLLVGLTACSGQDSPAASQPAAPSPPESTPAPSAAAVGATASGSATASPPGATASPSTTRAPATTEPSTAQPTSVAVTAVGETEPVPHSGDAADDPAIWVNPADPTRSTIIGTDKMGGLAVYDLDGREIQYIDDARYNNVDLRADVPLGGGTATVVTAGNRSDDLLAIFRVDPTTRRLEPIAAREIPTVTVYGSCMYRSAATGALYAFVNSEEGAVEQYELFESGDGQLDARRVRQFEVGSQTEGCVADDERGLLYIGEEDVALWRYGAEPDAGDDRTTVDTVDDGHLAADIEGLALYLGADGQGYLIASSQSSNDFAVYERAGDNRYLGRFRIEGGVVDGVTETDGIDVTSAALGGPFGQGLFVTQDFDNDADNQNFKLVPWSAIADALGLPALAAPEATRTATP